VPYYMILITIALLYILKSKQWDLQICFFFLKIVLAIQGSLLFHMNFTFVFLFLWEVSLGFHRHCIESVDHLGQYGHRQLFFSCCFLWYWGLNSGLCARQVLYHLNHTHKPYFAFLSYFSDKVLHFCSGPVLGHNPPICASQVAWIIGMNHHIWLVGWGGSL
jgi:hypothetical protein